MTVLYLMPLCIISHHTRSYTARTPHSQGEGDKHTHTLKTERLGSDAVLTFGERQDDLL